MKQMRQRLDSRTRVELANQLYREFYTVCFWHMKPDLQITEAMIPLMLKGLRTHGGWRGLLAAERLKD